MTFSEFFFRATGNQPFPYQARLAETTELPEVLEVPTGGGKTAFAVLAWLWRRRFAAPEVRERTPRRLVYCLPVRTLVDQTINVAAVWLENLGLQDDIHVYGMMGGAIDEAWESFPERDAIMVGTQDQLLSRALNRGYSMSRYRWPVHFGLLNNDVLWVLDETQLMGVGLSTSAQLQAFRNTFQSYGPARSLWMSATLDTRKLATIDNRDALPQAAGISDADRADERLARRLHARKRLEPATTLVQRDTATYARSLASEVAEAHQPDTVTLVILNRVARAQELYRAIRKTNPTVPLALIHSRFRPADRTALQKDVLSGNWRGILIATQAIEAGVDISARTLFTELAPWSSMVQRFGRCNRAGEFKSADVYWIDVPDEDKLALPYDVESLRAARLQLQDRSDVGIDHLPAHQSDDGVPTGPVIRRRELLELFDTQPDLSGCDVDISRYIRANDDRDVQVYWRNWENDTEPAREQPHRDELCSAPVWEVIDLVKNRKQQALRWTGLLGKWERPDRIVPGMQILLHSSTGGYDVDMGWMPASTTPIEPVIRTVAQQDSDDSEEPSTLAGRFMTIAEHTRDVLDQLNEILADANTEVPFETMRTAALWHDVGKAHPAFQELLLTHVPADDALRVGGPWAKSPTGRGGRISRPHFRHELVSSLSLLASGGDDLAAYLVAAHHGKVRMSMRSRPGEVMSADGRRTVLGVHDGDVIGPLAFGSLNLARVEIDLSLAALGEHNGSESWLSRTLKLLDTFGPFRLAYLEALLRAADWRASADTHASVAAEVT